MTSLAGRMGDVDALIFGVIGETAIIAGKEVKGILHRQYREIRLPGSDPFVDPVMVGLAISFDCRYSDDIAALIAGEFIHVEGKIYGFIRRVPDGGDESGLVILELSTWEGS